MHLFCGSLNILGLHLPLQSASFPQTYCDKYSLSPSSFYSTDTGFAIFYVYFIFFSLSGSKVCIQLSFFLISSWLLWLAHFLDFFPPLHFSASFNLPHCGVILERSFAGACLLALSPFCSCSTIIKCKYQHTLMFLHSCVSLFEFLFNFASLCDVHSQLSKSLSNH